MTTTTTAAANPICTIWACDRSGNRVTIWTGPYHDVQGTIAGLWRIAPEMIVRWEVNR